MLENASKLTETLLKFTDLGEKSLNLFLESGFKIRKNKGERLITAGEVADCLFFVEKGFIRSYYLREEKDITISFSLQGDFITSMSSFILQQPSYENVEAIEEASLWAIKHKALMNLFHTDQKLEHIYRLVLEHYYIRIEEELIFSKFKSTKERYLNLLHSRPEIIQKASVGQIASYLDMSIETLSRIRANI